MDINMVDIGHRIRDRRKQLGLTQTDIDRECGIASGALSQIENGNRTPSAITLYKLSQALNCNIEWLITGISTYSENMEIYEHEESLIKSFRELLEEDKEELLEILQMKLRKVQKRKETN